MALISLYLRILPYHSQYLGGTWATGFFVPTGPDPHRPRPAKTNRRKIDTDQQARGILEAR